MIASRAAMNEARKTYYNLCNPDEPLAPKDERNVDIDGDDDEVRGLLLGRRDGLGDRVAAIARVRASSPACQARASRPSCAASPRGSSARRARTSCPSSSTRRRCSTSTTPIGVPDILVAVVYKADEALLEGGGEGARPTR